MILEVGDWDQLSEKQQRLITDPGGEGLNADDRGALGASIARWRAGFDAALRNCPLIVTEYARIVTTELSAAGLRFSPRRARLLARTLLAAVAIEGGPVEQSFRTILECSLPQRAWGEKIEPEKVRAAHRLAWEANVATGSEKWLNQFHLKRTFCDQAAVPGRQLPQRGFRHAGHRTAAGE